MRRTTPMLLLAPRACVAATSPCRRDYSGSARSRHARPHNTVVKFVPQQEAWVVERFGKFHRILQPGLRFLLPFVEEIKYVQSLKEIALEIPSQSAVSNDNVTLHLDGVLYLRVVDPYKASYGVEYAEYAVSQLAQTTMRAEIGKLTLDQTFKERTQLNHAIVESMNSAVSDWGISCMRYEIRDILLPEDIAKTMQMQASAERRKRAAILDSEGVRQADINVAEGKRAAAVLASEATMIENVNRAKGESEAIELRAKATAEAVKRLAEALREVGGPDAVALRVAEQYVEAFRQVAKESTTILLPSAVGEPSSMVAQALTIFNRLQQQHPSKSVSSVSSSSSSSSAVPKSN